MKNRMYLLSLIFICPSLVSCGGKSEKTKLYFDGGGGSGNYNSTISMTKSAANPYPYNTLEKLAEEWNNKNDKFEIVINSNSLNGMRSAITSLLEAKKAPDMLFQTGGVINDDIGKNYYVDLSSYFEMDNPYVPGTKWKDIYNQEELATTKAADGNYYFACLDKVTVGLMYNMDVLNQAGITSLPETFSEFENVLETLKNAKQNGTIDADVFLHQGFWQEIYLNASIYGSKVSEWDQDGNNMVSSYELIKAFYDDKWNYNSEEFNEFLSLCDKKASYYPNNYLAYDTASKFSKGKLAITDGLGNNMRIAYKALGEKLAVSGYPKLDEESSKFGGYTCVRGSAGLSTAYWVTNSAMEKGQEAVDACVDFLMFLSSPENNKRMVNNLGFALPLNVEDNGTPLFDGLARQYEADMKESKKVMWNAVNLYNEFGLEFADDFEKAMGEFYGNNHRGENEYIIDLMSSKLQRAIEEMEQKYGWNFK